MAEIDFNSLSDLGYTFIKQFGKPMIQKLSGINRTVRNPMMRNPFSVKLHRNWQKNQHSNCSSNTQLQLLSLEYQENVHPLPSDRLVCLAEDAKKSRTTKLEDNKGKVSVFL